MKMKPLYIIIKGPLKPFLSSAKKNGTKPSRVHLFELENTRRILQGCKNQKVVFVGPEDWWTSMTNEILETMQWLWMTGNTVSYMPYTHTP